MSSRNGNPVEIHRQSKLALQYIVRKLIEDRTKRMQRGAQMRAENEELRLLLRSALWELAQVTESKTPARFVSEWLADRRKREA